MHLPDAGCTLTWRRVRMSFRPARTYKRAARTGLLHTKGSDYRDG